MGQPFFLAQVEGREPRRDGGAQILHRDGPGSPEIQSVSVLAFLDPFGPHNGATQIVRASHRDFDQQTAQITQGVAGDVLIFGSTFLHSATRNISGAPRRTLLICYAIEALRESYRQTRASRAVRMEEGPAYAL